MFPLSYCAGPGYSLEASWPWSLVPGTSFPRYQAVTVLESVTVPVTLLEFSTVTVTSLPSLQNCGRAFPGGAGRWREHKYQMCLAALREEGLTDPQIDNHVSRACSSRRAQQQEQPHQVLREPLLQPFLQQ